MKRLLKLLFLMQAAAFLTLEFRVMADETVFPEFSDSEEAAKIIEINENNLGDQKIMAPEMKKLNLVHKHILSNGMTILVREMHNIPKVSLQLWYNVGS